MSEQKVTQMFIEGAQWVRDLVGYSEGGEAHGVLDNIQKGLTQGGYPDDYKSGAKHQITVERERANKAVQS